MRVCLPLQYILVYVYYIRTIHAYYTFIYVSYTVTLTHIENLKAYILYIEVIS